MWVYVAVAWVASLLVVVLLLYAHGEQEVKARVSETPDEDPRKPSGPILGGERVGPGGTDRDPPSVEGESIPSSVRQAGAEARITERKADEWTPEDGAGYIPTEEGGSGRPTVDLERRSRRAAAEEAASRIPEDRQEAVVAWVIRAGLGPAYMLQNPGADLSPREQGALMVGTFDPDEDPVHRGLLDRLQEWAEEDA